MTEQDRNNISHNYISIYKYKQLKAQVEQLQRYLEYCSEFCKNKGIIYELLNYIDEKEGVVENDKETSNKLFRTVHKG